MFSRPSIRIFALTAMALCFDCPPSNRRYRSAKPKRALTPKQQKARAKGKRAKQARKQNRENLTIQLKQQKPV